MSFSKVHSAQVSYLKAKHVDIEVDISRGLYSFSIVGLGDKAVEEAKDRVSSAIKNSGFIAPKQKSEKVVISLAPAYSRKHGSLFDVAIALGYLEASGNIDIVEKDKKIFLGELSLNGKLRPVQGILPLTRFAKEKGFKEIFVPKINAREAALVENIEVYGANTLKEVIEHIDIKSKNKIEKQNTTKIKSTENKSVDFSEIRGQSSAKRGLEIAAAGEHNVALYGPPGTGKTLLAKAFSGIFPEITFEEMLDITSIHSAAGTLNKNFISERPFRSPHHSASYVAICGGGSNIKPGEVTLAHKGILFLDELPEFDRKVIDSLRQPLEDGVICISRASGSATYPAEFTLIATMNPCPCGYLETNVKECCCTANQISKYQQKISGPILDRIDMWIEVGQVSSEDLLISKKEKPESNLIRENIIGAREKQIQRNQSNLNSKLSPKEIESFCKLDENTKSIIKKASGNLSLSARSIHKIIKLSRTIADLDNSEKIKENHILEALQYRKR